MAMGGTYVAHAAVEDTISLLVRYDKNNAYGTCDAMSSAFGASHTDNTTVIYGTKGAIRQGATLEVFTTVENGEYPVGKFAPVALEEYDSRMTLLDDFAMAIQEDRDPVVSGKDGLMIADLMLSAYRSLKTRQSEKLATSEIWL